MASLLIWAIVTFVLTIIGGGIGYFVYIKTRPKKRTWIAKCYQISEGVKSAGYDKRGRLVSDLKLNDLVPYVEDIIERTEKAFGIVIYRLVKLNMSCNAVTSDLVEVWGAGKKEVSVLIQGDTATLLRKGYDRTTGNSIFQPMPRERIELIKSEILIKKDRNKREKDILQAITPWIVTGICMLALLGISYFLSGSFIDTSENNKVASMYASDKGVEIATIHREALSSGGGVKTIKEVIKKPEPIIPSIE